MTGLVDGQMAVFFHRPFTSHSLVCAFVHNVTCIVPLIRLPLTREKLNFVLSVLQRP